MSASVAAFVLIASKTTVPLVLALIATRLLKRRSAADRHLVWVVAVICALLIPVVTLIAHYTESEIGVATRYEFLAPTQSAGPAPVADGDRARFRVDAVDVTPPSRGSTTQFGDDGLHVDPTLILLLWLTGVLVVGARATLRLARVRTLASSAQELRDPILLERCTAIAGELGIRRRIQWLEGASDVMPMTFGIMRSALLLPSGMSGWPLSRQHAVLRHELAHIRRRDSLTQLLSEIACVVYWFNPLIWLADRRLYWERELACDDSVLLYGLRPLDYASELLEIARLTRAAPHSAAVIAMARPSQLRSRLHAVLDDRVRRQSMGRRVTVAIHSGALMAVLPLSALTPEAIERHTLRPLQSLGPVPRVENAPGGAHSERVTRGATKIAARSSQAVSADTVAPPRISEVVSTMPLVRSAVALHAPRVAAPISNPCARPENALLANGGSLRDGWIATWQHQGCTGEIRVTGTVRFDRDYSRVTALGRNARIVITRDDAVSRRMSLDNVADALKHTYMVDGSEVPSDAVAEDLMAGSLELLFRVGYMADERAHAVLRNHGDAALFEKIGELRTDHSRTRYLDAWLKNGNHDEQTAIKAIEVAGATLRIDYYRAEIMTALIKRVEVTPAVEDAISSFVAGTAIEYYRTQINTALERATNQAR